MKIAVSSKGNKLTSQVDERFGRCAFFMIIEPESLEYEVIENTGSEQGAGVTAAKTIVNAGAQALITGSCGPKAFMVLKEANTDVILNGAG
ncbi:MAG: NifB/NifX family molybdenum-iron cluster-binding protein, partial [Thermodesulfobacteriota bacterium]